MTHKEHKTSWLKNQKDIRTITVQLLKHFQALFAACLFYFSVYLSADY